jgi:hypothetical protein
MSVEPAAMRTAVKQGGFEGFLDATLRSIKANDATKPTIMAGKVRKIKYFVVL